MQTPLPTVSWQGDFEAELFYPIKRKMKLCPAPLARLVQLLSGGFSAHWACWICSGACGWEKSLWWAAQLNEAVHEKRNKIKRNKRKHAQKACLIFVWSLQYRDIFTKTWCYETVLSGAWERCENAASLWWFVSFLTSKYRLPLPAGMESCFVSATLMC